jgi:enoyl-CoA hydratase
MEPAAIELETRDSVAILTLNRPRVLNAINRRMLSELSSTLDVIDRTAEIGAVVVRGAGEKAFSAGADVREFDEIDNEGMLELMNEGHAVFQRLSGFRCPVIAAVHGYALGGGFELALSCDFILASENASFACPELSLGSFPGWGGTVRLVQAIGARAAKQLIFTGERIDASRAFPLGIVNHVYGNTEFFGEVESIAKSIAAQSPIALRVAKQVLNAEAGGGDRAYHLLEALGVASIASTQDRKDRLKAFAERRSRS